MPFREQNLLAQETNMRSCQFVHRFNHHFILLLLILICSPAFASAEDKPEKCANNLGSPIENFCVVTPDVLWRGARPDKEGAAWLIGHGIRTIVNLELILDDKSALSQAVVPDDNTYEVNYFSVRDWEPLPIIAPSVTDDHVAHFLAITKDQPKPVYVHCRSGMNRTGVMVAAYRVIIEGVKEEQAIEEMGRYNGQWFEADAKYIRSLSPERQKEIRDKISEWMPKLKKEAQVICKNGKCSFID